MREFANLTARGQSRRLRSIAFAALESYPLTVERLSLVAAHTNTIFRVDTTDGARYALRIGTPDEQLLDWLQVEVGWLRALARTPGIDVAVPVTDRSGAPFVEAEAPGVPEARRCVLFEWIPGVPLAERLDTAGYRRFGALAARLHDHAAGFAPPAPAMRWDKVFHYPEEMDPLAYRDPGYAVLYTPERLDIIERAIDVAQRGLDRLWASGDPILIHSDLHFWNAHVHRNRLIAFDFEVPMLGFPIQDVAVTLFYGRTRSDYPDLRRAFIEGYRTIRPWPGDDEEMVDTIMAARTLMFVNYVGHRDLDADDYLEVAVPRLGRFLARYGH